MALWGKNDASSNAVKHSVVSGSAVTGVGAYGNSTVGAIVGKQVVGLHGVDTTEATVAGGKVTHPGWVLTRQGTGPVKTIEVTAGGSNYASSDVGTVSNGTSNATFSLTVASGVITGVNVTNFGNGFINTAAILVSIANSTGGATGGTGATFAVTLGGRAGRIHHETLVAMGSMTGDGVDDALFPDV